MVITLLTLLTMTLAGVLVYLLETNRIERRVFDQINQEDLEFREFQSRSPRDPQSGAAITTVPRLLGVYLRSQVPDDDELLMTYVDNQPVAVTSNQLGHTVIQDPAFEPALGQILETGGTRDFETSDGVAWVTAIPVVGPESSGALVMVNFPFEERRELIDTMRTYAVVSLLALALITTLGAFQAGRLLAPLRALRQTATEISAQDLSGRIPERGNDDVTALTRTINGMLERLELGFGEQRQFLDDAGHELRTPLTVIGGHLELMDPTDPGDVGSTRDLVLDEVDRMSRLVGDLILLAKSRRPDFVCKERVWMGSFLPGVFQKASALGDRDWQFDGAPDAWAVLDEQRITQAVLQLADNAVKHTDPHDVIRLGAAMEADSLRIWVSDTGDGIDDELRPVLFERFARGQTPRPGDEGFGLGLSIVHAILSEHGGSISVDSVSPHGTRFELVLPQA